MGTEFLGRDGIEDRSGFGLNGDVTVSAWDTNKRKEMGLTHGPGGSAAEEACDWARDWAGDAGLRELG